MDVVQKVLSTLNKYSMLSGGEKVLIGLSGGPDSVCLSSVLNSIAPKFRLVLHALYVDHGLRPEETPGEARFCESFCRSIDIRFHFEKVDVKSYCRGKKVNKQEGARVLRYEALGAVARAAGADRIALGHTLDDQIETFFMRALRGSGIRGLSGIPPVRGNIIRPLLEVEKNEVEAYLKKEGIGFVVDSSNLSGDYLRNRLRASLMPAIREISPSAYKTLGRTADIFREEDRYLDLAVNKAMLRLISRKDENSIELFSSPLETMDTVLLRRVLRRAMEETEGIRGVGFVHTEDVVGLVRDGLPGDRIDLPGGIRAVKKYSTLLITSEPVHRLGTYEMEGDGEVLLREAGLVLRARTLAGGVGEDRQRAVFDADEARFPLTVRARTDGDFFHPSGFGKRKKLQDFFVDEKVPREERDRVPVVTSGGNIVWVAGMRGDERFRPTEKTKRFLVLEIKAARA